jgi:arsenate reductase (thioredoxin)
MRKQKVLFLCTGNSARSQMAEAFLAYYGGTNFEAYSAGLDPRGIHPYTRQVMGEIGLDLANQYSKGVGEYLGKVSFSYLITLCSHAEKNCPTTFLGFGQRMHWDFDDPASSEGTEEEKLAKFRQVRDQIDRQIRDWLVSQGTALE